LIPAIGLVPPQTNVTRIGNGYGIRLRDKKIVEENGNKIFLYIIFGRK
jgi:hypothetical protein